MIKKLEIKNFAIIDSQIIDFTNGFNIILGETGAGKSLLIDAMLLLAGSRASADLVQKDQKKAIIEGTFEIDLSNEVFRLIDELNLDSLDSVLIIRREISHKGINRCFINDSPVQVSDLKRFGSLIFDFHGQHQHQSLLDKEKHLEIIDNLIIDKSIFQNYSDEYNKALELDSKLKNIKSQEREFKEKESFRRFQFEEINKINPLENEDKSLEAELELLENAEWIVATSNDLNYDLYSKEGSLIEVLNDAIKKTLSLSKFESNFNIYSNELKTALVSITEVANFARDYSNSIDYNPDKVESARIRLKELKSLQKKYGSIESIIELKKQLEEQLNITENFHERINSIKKELDISVQNAFSYAVNLSNHRKSVALDFSSSIINSLKNLGIENGNFKVNFDYEVSESGIFYKYEDKSVRLSPSGIDAVEFMLSTNLGEAMKPLTEVASGGEISRIMLAIKSIVADISKIPVMIFDEIDSGISGRIAQKAGIAMKNLAEKRQIIAITHLPQIAALAQHAIYVKKSELDTRTISESKVLNIDELQIEVAKLLAGENINQHHLNTAKELMKTV